MKKKINGQIFQVCDETVFVTPKHTIQLILGRKFHLLSWKRYWVTINWSDPYILKVEKWREYIISTTLWNYNHLENVLEFSHKGNFLYYFGVDNFIQYWPGIRGFCPQRLFGSRKLYDVMWTFLYSPYFCMIPPLPTIFDLSSLERKMLIYVCMHPRITIDEIYVASRLDRDVIKSTLSRLIDLQYLIQINGEYGRSNYFTTYQVERPRRKITYSVKGKTKTFITSKTW